MIFPHWVIKKVVFGFSSIRKQKKRHCVTINFSVLLCSILCFLTCVYYITSFSFCPRFFSKSFTCRSQIIFGSHRNKTSVALLPKCPRCIYRIQRHSTDWCICDPLMYKQQNFYLPVLTESL